jgi:adenylate kinase family enzyme
MKRVIVIGSGGAGKSKFSRRLGEITRLPVIHLDRLFWRSGWVPTPKEEWKERVSREIERPEWIMDGNFGGTREMRMAAADTIIMLDLSRWLCIYRILKRTLLYRPGSRSDMAEGCHERLDMEFILWVWNYPRRSRKNALAEMEKFSEKDIIILKTRREVEQFLQRLGSEYT